VVKGVGRVSALYPTLSEKVRTEKSLCSDDTDSVIKGVGRVGALT
jgi:hypothetical protein